MKPYLYTSFFLGLLSASLSAQSVFPQHFFLGTYTDGKSEGIYEYRLHEDGSIDSIGLIIHTEQPSYLIRTEREDELLTVQEVSNGKQEGWLSLYQNSASGWNLVSRESTGGAHPCHLDLNPEGYVAVANYTGGSMAFFRLNADSRTLERLSLDKAYGTGPHRRQEASHMHGVKFDPQRNSLYSVNLGTDLFTVYDLKLSAKPKPAYQIALSPGSGPRQLVIHPYKPWIYVLTELAPGIELLKENRDNKWQVSNRFEISTSNDSENLAADIRLHPNGKFLYASVRGSNTLHVFDVDQETGMLKESQVISSGGLWPRFFTFDKTGKFLIAANQHSEMLCVFSIAPETGKLTMVSEYPAPSPVSIAF